jgi:predicted N-acetyltransferase YhbS
MEIEYRVNQEISADEFIDVLRRSTLAERRPVEDRACIEGMLQHANLLVTAWDGDRLIGVSRSVTDFNYCCYLSDLAVDTAYQKQGIGKRLIAETQQRLGPQCTIILLSAPAAVEYYPRIGFQHHPQAWLLPRAKSV